MRTKLNSSFNCTAEHYVTHCKPEGVGLCKDGAYATVVTMPKTSFTLSEEEFDKYLNEKVECLKIIIKQKYEEVNCGE